MITDKDIKSMFTEAELNKEVTFRELIVLFRNFAELQKNVDKDFLKNFSNIIDILSGELQRLSYENQRLAAYVRANIVSASGLTKDEVLQEFTDFCKKFDKINEK